MEQTKFNMNSVLIILFAFTAIILFFSVILTNMSILAYRRPVDVTYPVEGTKVFIRYSSVKESGVYEGLVNAGMLKVKGEFGYGWGAAAEGDVLWCNEYFWTDIGLVHCNLVKIDLKTYEKTLVARDTMLRGRCSTGELVCVADAAVLSNVPADNPLWSLFAMSTKAVTPQKKGANVLLLDPVSGEVVYSVWETGAAEENFIEDRYVGKTLDEVTQ